MSNINYWKALPAEKMIDILRTSNDELVSLLANRAYDYITELELGVSVLDEEVELLGDEVWRLEQLIKDMGSSDGC